MMMTYSKLRCPIVVRTTETRVLLTMACDTEGTCISRGFRCRHRICQICWPLALGCRLVVVIGSQFGTGPPGPRARSGAARQVLSQSWAAVSCRERLTCWAGWQKPNNRSFLVAERFGTRKNAAGRDPRKGAVVGLGLCDDFSAGYQKFMVGVHMDGMEVGTTIDFHPHQCLTGGHTWSIPPHCAHHVTSIWDVPEYHCCPTSSFGSSVYDFFLRKEGRFLK